MTRSISVLRWVAVPLLVISGVCISGYGLWRGFFPGAHDRARERRVAVALDRLSAIGAQVGRLPGRPVEALDYQATAVSDGDLAVLADLPTIERIDLSSTIITDRGLAHLRHLPRLQVLRLNNTRVTDRGLANIENCRGLSLLHLANTGVDLNTLKLNTLPGLRIIDCKGSPVGDGALANISKATQLKGLGLSYTEVSDAELVRLRALTALEVLDLSGTAVSDRGAAALREIKLPALRAVLFSECTFTAKGIRELSELHVRHLNFSGAKLPFPDTIAILAKNASLRELVLDRTDVRDEDLRGLAQGFPELTTFQARKTSLSDACLKELGDHPKLKLLVLHDTRITEDAVDRFRATCPHMDVRYGKEPIGPRGVDDRGWRPELR